MIRAIRGAHEPSRDGNIVAGCSANDLVVFGWYIVGSAIRSGNGADPLDAHSGPFAGAVSLR